MSLDHRALRESLVLRPEAAADQAAVGVLTDAAFGADGEESVERRLLRRLREDGDLIDELTLVAEVDGEVIGHVACSEYFQAKPLRSWRDELAGPFAYAPAFSDL